MNFFEQQDLARRNSKKLLFYFLVTVLLIVGAVDLFVVCLWYYGLPPTQRTDDLGYALVVIVVFTSVLTLFSISIASLYRIFRLRKGGLAIAKLLNAVEVERSSTDNNEKRLLNIIEEMAIASGLVVPQVFIMKNEMAINAMVAGHNAESAVIIVTQGCLETLNRDELQGVIGHEFSHIFNGDMKLNIRLLGVLNGILILSTLGYGIIRISDRKSSSNNWGFFLIGGVLILIGSIGNLFAQIIKSAVSREREFLADAAAVQFTRNPLGIKDALVKIGGIKQAKLINHHAAEMSHMFFTQGVFNLFNEWFASHPPIQERIQRIDPHSQVEVSTPTVAPTQGKTSSDQSFAIMAMASMGAPTQRHLDHAANVLLNIPQRLQECTRSAIEAKGVIFALLLNSDDATRNKQITILSTQGQQDEGTLALSLVEELKNLKANFRFAVVELCIPTLKTLPSGPRAKFLECVSSLINADDDVSLFECGLECLLKKALSDSHSKSQGDHFLNLNSSQIKNACRHLFSFLIHLNFAPGAEEASTAFSHIMKDLGLSGESFLPSEKCSEKQLQWDFEVLNRLRPIPKSKLIECCMRAILLDEKITFKEAEAAQVLCAALDCPLPPLLNVS